MRVRTSTVLTATRKNSSTMKPTTRRRYWYSSFELRLPDWLLRQVGIEAGDRVAVSVVDGVLVGVPLSKQQDSGNESTRRPRAA